MDTTTPDHMVDNRLTRVRAQIRSVTSNRMKLRRALMLGGVGLVAAVVLIFWLFSGRYTGTNDSYIRAAKLLVTTDVSGLVLEVYVKEGQAVKAGDELFRLDPIPFQIALDNAKAKQAQTLLDIQAMKDDYARMLQDIQAGEAQAALDQRNADRSSALVKRGNVSRQDFDTSQMTLEVDTRRLESLRQQAQSQLSKLGGRADIPSTDHPAYKGAKAAVDEAQRQLDHSIVRAPFDGTVTEVDSLQPGTLVISALSSFSTTSAVALVSRKNLWVEAQMKETDLTYVKAGDPVTVKIDSYPGRKWQGRVESVSPASGSAFSVLPAQNASGNWVKIVQRIAVKVSFEMKPGDPQLREGMSADVEIDTGQRRWNRMLFGPRS